MPNGDTQAGLDRESFARAWATGDEMERGRMIYDLYRHGYDAKVIVKKHLQYIYGGLVVVSFLAAVVLKQIGILA